MTLNIPMCFECKNKLTDYTCKAFPDGIPDKILFGKVDHTKPYNGDHGIQFEPVDDEQ